jgi:hypothetical protein
MVTSAPVGLDTIKPMFQKMLSKKGASSQSLDFSDMSSHFLRQCNDLGTAARFLLKQMVESTTRNSTNSGSLERDLEEARQEIIQLKQTLSSRDLENQAIHGDLQNRVQGLQQQLEEKENVINKFRRLHGGSTSPHATTIPLSSHSHRSSMPQGNTYHGEPQQQQQAQPPIRGFMANRAAEERNRQQVLQSQLHRSVPILGGRSTSTAANPHHSNIPSGITPIQVSRGPFAGNNSPGVASVGSRIRDFTSNAGFTFTSRPLHHHPYQRTTSHRTSPAQPGHTRHLSPSTSTFGRNYESRNTGSNHLYQFGH